MLELSADQGNTAAQSQLASLHFSGNIGVSKDLDKVQYENQINRLDEENMQLRVQNEIVKQNRITSSEQTEIEELRQTARTQEESIQRLSSQINLIRVNQHQDYRAGSGRLVGN